MTPKEIFLELLKKEGCPERLLDQYEALQMALGDPVSRYLRAGQVRGSRTIDRWGVTILFPEDAPGTIPYHSEEATVLKDITRWKEVVHAPDIKNNCQEGWEEYRKAQREKAGDQRLLAGFMGTGIFEQCHFLMGFEDTLTNFYEHPKEMHELIDCITQFELDYAAELCKYVKPDALFHHDDWGSQISTFLSPDMFREFIKPAFMKIYGYYKSHGVQVIAHHSDSYAATLVPDMIDMGIDIWQGVMTSNNVPELSRKYGGKISFMGDIDSAKVDYEGWTKEVVQAEVDRACAECGTLYFIPNASQGLPMSTFPGVYEALSEAIDNCSKRYFPAQNG